MPVSYYEATVTDLVHLKLLDYYNDSDNLDVELFNKVGNFLRNVDNDTELNTNQGLIKAILNLGEENLNKLGFDKKFLDEVNERSEKDNFRFDPETNRFINQRKVGDFSNSQSNYEKEGIKRKDNGRFIESRRFKYSQSDKRSTKHTSKYKDYIVQTGESRTIAQHKRILESGHSNKDFINSKYINLHLMKVISGNWSNHYKPKIEVIREAFYSEFIKILAPKHYYKIRGITTDNELLDIKLAKNTKGFGDILQIAYSKHEIEKMFNAEVNVKSFIESYLLSFVLSIGDRHLRNTVVNKSGFAFNIDYGELFQYKLDDFIAALNSNNIDQAKQIIFNRLFERYIDSKYLQREIRKEISKVSDVEFLTMAYQIFCTENKEEKLKIAYEKYKDATEKAGGTLNDHYYNLYSDFMKVKQAITNNPMLNTIVRPLVKLETIEEENEIQIG